MTYFCFKCSKPTGDRFYYPPSCSNYSLSLIHTCNSLLIMRLWKGNWCQIFGWFKLLKQFVGKKYFYCRIAYLFFIFSTIVYSLVAISGCMGSSARGVLCARQSCSGVRCKVRKNFGSTSSDGQFVRAVVISKFNVLALLEDISDLFLGAKRRIQAKQDCRLSRPNLCKSVAHRVMFVSIKPH